MKSASLALLVACTSAAALPAIATSCSSNDNATGFPAFDASTKLDGGTLGSLGGELDDGGGTTALSDGGPIGDDDDTLGPDGSAGDDDASTSSDGSTALDAAANDAGNVSDAGHDTAPFVAPVLDGVVSAGEYGSTTDGTHQVASSSGQTWYFAYDNTNFYVAVTGGNLQEAAILYLSSNPDVAPGSGSVGTGNVVGYLADKQKPGMLPFYAKLFLYVKDGTFQASGIDLNGGWSAPVDLPSNLYKSSTTGNVREFSIPWSTMGGVPVSLGMLGFLTSSTGYVYGGVPTTNPQMNIGTNASFGSFYDTVNLVQRDYPFEAVVTR